MNAPAIEECRRRGFNAYCGTIEAAQTGAAFPGIKFDVVTSFHCLEHVDHPVEFVRSLAALTRPGGRIFLSTPYSPMSFEAHWFDVMNHPPHHLTRWNLAAYRQLSALLGLPMRYFTPSFSALKNAIGVFRMLQYGFPRANTGETKLGRDILLHFFKFTRCCLEQLKRPTEVNTDVILVELTVA